MSIYFDSREANTVLYPLLGETGLIAWDLAVTVSNIRRDILVRDNAAEKLRTMPDNRSKARMHPNDCAAIENLERCLGGTITKLDEEIDNQAERIDSLLTGRLDQPDSPVPDILPLREIPPGSWYNQTNYTMRKNDGDTLIHSTLPSSVSCGPPILEPSISNPTPPLSFQSAKETRIIKKNPTSSPSFQSAKQYHMPTKKRLGPLKEKTDMMLAWLMEHRDHPYLSEADMQMFMQQTELTSRQIGDWFMNARRCRERTLRRHAKHNSIDNAVGSSATWTE